MAVDLGASFKIAASVQGQQAIDNLNKSVGSLTGLAKGAGLALAGLGAGVGLSVLKDKFDEIISSAANLKDVAERTGSTVENMGALSRAANLTNNDFGEVEKAIIKMNKALAGSDDASKGAAHALEAIGLSSKELRQLDPAEAFKRISTAMAGFEEGAGKVAVAMDIFGKNGAQVIPFMNDLVDVGDLVSKTTKEQAEQADQYEKNLKRLSAAKGELYKVISMQVLPVADAFVKMLVDTNTETNGVRGAVKGLADDGLLTSVFKEAARAAAAFMDILSLVGKAVAQLGSSLAVIANDIATAVELAVKAPGAMFKDGGLDELRRILDQRRAFVAAANEDMAKRWATVTPFTDSLEKQFQQMGQPSAPSAPRSSALKGYQSKDVTPKVEKADPFKTEMDSLGREAAKLEFQAKHITEYEDKITSAREAQIRFDIEFGKFKDLTEKQKIQLLMQASAVDTFAEKLRVAKEGLDFDKQTKKIEAETRAIGLNNLEKQKLIALQDLENRGIKEGTAEYERLSQRRIKALEDQKKAQQSPMAGAMQGFNDIADVIENRAARVRDALVNAFNTGADALTEFVMTGKLNFSGFAQSVIKDIINMIIKQQMFNALSAFKNAGGFGQVAGALGGLGSIFGGGGGSTFVNQAGGVELAGSLGFANGGVMTSAGSMPLHKYASGGIANSPQVAIFGEGRVPEAYVPLNDGRTIPVTIQGGTQGGQAVNVNVTVNAQTGQVEKDGEGSFAKLGAAIANAVRAEIVVQRRPGGLLAA